MTDPSIVVENVTCLGCGCACDDIGIVVRDGRIVEARNACHLGARWFGDGRVPARSHVDGKDVSAQDAVLAAAKALTEASQPLVFIAPGVSCEAQREAAAIADLLRGRLDSVTSATVPELVLVHQEHGYASATLGEVRNRADVIVLWATDLAAKYPRFSSRYAPDPAGTALPHGRRSRTVIAVDVGGARATIDADHRLAVDPADEIATLASIEAMVRAPADSPLVSTTSPNVPWTVARELAPALLAGRYIALIYDAEPDDRAQRSAQRFAALTSLSQSLNDRTRCATIALRAGGNRSGADSVLVAQTGYPFAVDFARGYPRYLPHENATLPTLARREVDVVLIVGDAASVPEPIGSGLAGVRTIVVGPRASDHALGAPHVVIDTGVDGIHSAGTAVRADDVPLPLRASLAAPRAAAVAVGAVRWFVRLMQFEGACVILESTPNEAAAQP